MAHAGMAIGPYLARHVAVRRLDLDDVGAHVAEHLGRERPHQHRRQVDDSHAIERPFHGRPSSAAKVSGCNWPP
ncbi:Uncharacterised protein [Bordetella pertussis]|nr:Uncharacterised protein [Bordetella pertussis]